MNVAVNATVTATFSEAMSSSTLTASTFTLTAAGGAAVTGTVSYANSVATFTPSASLAYSTQYTGTITTGAQSSSGTALAVNYTWSFTTAAVPVPPTVTAVTPASAATGVAISTTVTAAFSQAMNSSTITTSTFTLAGPGGSVAGTVTYAATGSVATFTPSASLAYSTQYTATITTGAQDSAGTALAANYTWSFTTSAAPVPPTVTAVTPASAATGVAISTTVTAAFSQPMSTSTITSSTFTLTGPGGSVAGTVTYAAAGSVATFTPSANLAYSTQYTAAITTGAQDSAGTALAANNTWSFTTSAAPVPPTVTAVTPASAATGVAVATTVTAAFSQPMNSSTITSSTFTLTGPGGSVAGTVTYATTGSVATFAPSASLAYSTQYTATITTGAQDSAGTALAANYSWTFTTAAAAPTVIAVTPASAATGVAVSTAVTATFSQAMNSSTITSSTFTLTGPGGSVAGTFAYGVTGSVAAFTPSANLAFSTQYTATITTGAQSSAGTALAANYSWTFTTAAALAPTVTATDPVNGATGVSATTPNIFAAFSQPMNSTTITTSTFTLTPAGGAPVAGTVTYSAGGQCGLICPPQATFTPSANLAYGTQYTATITTGAQSSAGVALAANYTWTFVTSPAPPAVLAVTPTSAATGVAVGTTLTATFNGQSMNASTINSSTFTLTATGGASVTGTVTFAPTTSIATFTPSATLAFDTQYTATLTTGVTNAAGTPLAQNYTWTFTTAASNPNLATVDFSDNLQTIRGFGGSTAWLGVMPQAVATALFSPTNGLGLSILRVRIDPEGSPSGGGASGDPYETGEWDQELTNAQEAVAANAKAIVFASPWTAPASMKSTSTTQPYSSCTEGTGYCGGYLNPADYAAYATYLEDFVSFFNANAGFNLYAISMQNEPDQNATYESCLWTPQQMDTWVASNASTITSDPYHTKFMMPESNSFVPAQAATALSDTNAEGQISIVAGHIYQVLFGGSITAYPPFPAGDTPKELWMTEFGPLSTATPTWTEALTTYAPTIHNSMVVGQYNAYVWWGIFGAPTNAGSYGFVDNSGNLTVFGWVMGQYSKFVLPGYTHVGVTDSAGESANVLISAYTGTESGTQHYVIVAINTSGSPVSQSFTLQNGTVTSMTPYQSTSAAGLVPQSAIAVTGDAFTYTLPAQSITTFVQ